MIDLEAAKALRSDGLSYKEIAERLSCSVAWCKKNLGGVEKGTATVERIKVDATKELAIQILKAALARIEAL